MISNGNYCGCFNWLGIWDAWEPLTSGFEWSDDCRLSCNCLWWSKVPSDIQCFRVWGKESIFRNRIYRYWSVYNCYSAGFKHHTCEVWHEVSLLSVSVTYRSFMNKFAGLMRLSMSGRAILIFGESRTRTISLKTQCDSRLQKSQFCDKPWNFSSFQVIWFCFIVCFYLSLLPNAVWRQTRNVWTFHVLWPGYCTCVLRYSYDVLWVAGLMVQHGFTTQSFLTVEWPTDK